MPGRGRPWRGVGEGNPDRIGTGAIADGSITEADLDTNVTSKLNSGGGHQIQDEGTPLTDRTELIKNPTRIKIYFIFMIKPTHLCFELLIEYF